MLRVSGLQVASAFAGRKVAATLTGALTGRLNMVASAPHTHTTGTHMHMHLHRLARRPCAVLATASNSNMNSLRPDRWLQLRSAGCHALHINHSNTTTSMPDASAAAAESRNLDARPVSSAPNSKSLTQQQKAATDAIAARAQQAQRTFVKDAKYTQALVDRIFHDVALAANVHRLDLAKIAVQDTNMGIVEDKVIKNHFASEFVYNKVIDHVFLGFCHETSGAGG